MPPMPYSGGRFYKSRAIACGVVLGPLDAFDDLLVQPFMPDEVSLLLAGLQCAGSIIVDQS